MNYERIINCTIGYLCEHTSSENDLLIAMRHCGMYPKHMLEALQEYYDHTYDESLELIVGMFGSIE